MPKASFFLAASLLATLLFAFIAPPTSKILISAAAIFSFLSMRDGQAETASFTTTVNQITTLGPDLVIFNGD